MSQELGSARELIHSWQGRLDGSFALAYGSAVSGSAASDYDLLIVSPSFPSAAVRSRLIEELLDLHVREGRMIDQEVPHDNKLFYSLDELDEVLGLSFATPLAPGFLDIKYLDQADDDDPYFDSREMRLRLLFNALTSPNALIGGSPDLLNAAKRAAQRSLGKMVCHLQSGDDRCVETLLAVSLDGVAGKDYLGYFATK